MFQVIMEQENNYIIFIKYGMIFAKPMMNSITGLGKLQYNQHASGLEDVPELISKRADTKV